jgi:hypothetical protein
MRLVVLPLALLVAATPAAAQMRSQPVSIPNRPPSINGTSQASIADRRQYVVRPYVVVDNAGWRGELREIDRRIRHARENGEISRREARALRRQVTLIWSIGNAYAANGYTDSELYALDSQTFALRDLAQAPGRPVPPPRRGH